MARLLKRVSRFVDAFMYPDQPRPKKIKRVPGQMPEELLRLTPAARMQFVLDTEAEKIAKEVTSDDIEVAYANDPYLKNFYLNLWEMVHGKTVLKTYPWNVALPLADLCNARCTFCNSWLAGRNVLSLQQLERYEEVLRYARIVGLQGHGEPLVNPQIDQILDRLAVVLDPRSSCYIITNGVFLPKRVEKLLNANVKTFNFSLNAITPETHDLVMGLGANALEIVLKGIRELVAIRDAGRKDIKITISFVLTSDNCHEAAGFVRLANEMRVDRLYLRTLAPLTGTTPPGLNYHLLPPYRHPDFDRHFDETVAALDESQVEFEAFPSTWRAQVVRSDLAEAAAALPVVTRSEAVNDPKVREYYRASSESKGRGRFLYEPTYDDVNPFNRAAPFDCRFIYQQLISTYLTFRLVPCCYITDVPGHEPLIFDGERPFFDYWNSDAMVFLRKGLREGPLLTDCKRCPMQG